MGSMANIGTPYQGQGAISGANALDPTTAYLNTFDLTNPSADASTGTTTSYGGGLGQSAYNVPTTPVSQQQPGVPTTYTSVPVSSGYALTPDLTGPGIAPSNATLNGNPVASNATLNGNPVASAKDLSNIAKILAATAGVAGVASAIGGGGGGATSGGVPSGMQTTSGPQLNWNYSDYVHPAGSAMGHQYLNPTFSGFAHGGLASLAPVNSSDRYPTDEEAKEAFNAAFPTQNYTQPKTNPYVQSLQDLLVQMRLLPNNQVGVPSPESQNMAIGRGHYAHGGEIYSLGSYSDGGRLLKGPGDGMSDDIPATIGHNQPARLAEGEFVIPADVVSHLGNGSTEAGSKVLYQMMDRVRRARTGNPKQGKQIKANKFMPA